MRPLTRAMRLRIRLLGASLSLSQHLRRLNRWLATPILARDIEVPPAHRCVFESRRGIVSERAHWLLCDCGRWAEVGLGTARGVPAERTPPACLTLSRMHKAGRELRNCALALAVGILFLVALFPEVMFR
ncbi:MAG: hypothetical protein WA213_20930 [Terriglobales bacterium]